jgi:hypothetical protein
MRLIALSTLLLTACGTPGGGTKDTGDTGAAVPVDGDLDGFAGDADCNDQDATIYDGAPELCDGLDNDCDGETDEDGQTTYYEDLDADGFGGAEAGTGCEVPSGMVADSTDCDDGNAAINPGAAEICDGADNDCDSLVDDADDSVTDATTVYTDGDGDGYGDGDGFLACSVSAGQATQAGDCNDGDAAYHPGAEESDCTDPEDYNCDGSSGYTDGDGDGFSACEDCDDSEIEVNPTSTEVCDGVDNDCDGTVDGPAAADAGTYYADADGDGYGDDASTTTDCSAPAGYVALGGDCDDTDAAYNPGASEADCADPNDYNCDGSVGYADNDGDGYAACEECDDADAANNPAATEVCDGADNDCDSEVDEDDAADASAWYADGDGDNYGDEFTTTTACSAPTGYVADSTDCDDGNATINPGADEVCNDEDDDCDGELDEDDAADATAWYADGDEDGYGDATVSYVSCDAPTGYVAAGTDCDDGDGAVNPGATEMCNGGDDDCDGDIDEDDAADASDWYADADTDGYGDATNSLSACSAPSGYVADATDCDDTTDAVNPGADELCNGGDDDCDGTVDEDDAADALTWYADGDGDGYGDADTSYISCAAPSGYLADDTDCDDGDAAINPAASEVCDSLDTDEDCSGAADDADAGATGKDTFYADADSDGYGDPLTTADACDAPTGYTTDATDCDDGDASENPAADEVCDGDDDDCDGDVDEDAAIDVSSWYADGDGDGYGDASTFDIDCDQPTGYVADDTDCDDTESATNPGADEYCNGTDDDCDGETDEADAVDPSTWYADSDADGYGDAATSVEQCDSPADYVSDDTDCDDDDPAVNPAAIEVCDAADTDEDCSGFADDDDPAVTGQSTLYADTDGDGYGDAAASTQTCEAPADFVTDNTDCDDGNAAVNPGEIEVCDSLDVDEDCNGLADDADSGATGMSTWYEDADGDDYGLSTSTVDACDEPSGYAATSGDCDDTEDAVNPAAAETCDNGRDDNCDGDDNDCELSGDLVYTEADAYYTGTSASEYFGGGIAMVGDTNGDGYDDLGVGAYGYRNGTKTQAGSLSILTGPLTSGSATSATRVVGDTAYDYLGYDVAGLGDTNIDTYDDLAVSAYGYDSGSKSGAGRVYIMRGPITSSDVDTAAYMTVTGDAASDNAGYAVASAGDFNDDGTPDLAVGVPYSDNTATNAGSVSVFLSYSAGDFKTDEAEWIFDGEATGDYAGAAVGPAGDVNGDGFDDLPLGAYAVGTNSGSAYLMFGETGSTGGAVALSSADAEVTGATNYGRMGISVAVVGDTDDDGYDDLLVGEDYYGASSAPGYAHLFFGGSALTGALGVGDAGASFSGESTDDYAGRAVTRAGDVNLDGYDEILYSGTAADSTLAGVGAAWLFYGGTDLSGSISGDDADAVMRGKAAYDALGNDLTGNGDVNGDGYPDFAVASLGVDSGSTTSVGMASVWYGGGI